MVSIRAPAWGATTRDSTRTGPLESFNPRPRVGGDDVVERRRVAALVSIRAPAWGATRDDAVHLPERLRFQSAPPRGGRRGRGHGGCHYAPFQSAPPRGGRPHAARKLARHQDVSIRAPAWGATIVRSTWSKKQCVSIRAPAWGATFGGIESLVLEVLFQSAPPRGGRPRMSRRIPLATVFQSAPPRGGRHAIRSREVDYQEFQSAPPRGGRPFDGRRFRRPREFQSAPPRGGRRGRGRTSPRGRNRFNPRPRVGGDARNAGQRPNLVEVSIRAPAWGATARSYLVVKERKIPRFARTAGIPSPIRPIRLSLRQFRAEESWNCRICEPPANPWSLWVRASSNYEWAIWIVRGLRPNVLDTWPPIGPEPIEPQTVCVHVDFLGESCAEQCPLRGIDFALEDRILDSLSEVLADPRNSSEPSPPGSIARGNVVGDQHQHIERLPPEKRGVRI